jgi:prepilin-type N-terminal cleavage/methylation domain-containing protein
MNRARNALSILRQFGFSLVELIVVIVVLGIIASMGAVVVRDGMLGYLRGREITSADWQGRLALERISRELRDIAPPAGGVANITNASCGSSTFAFSDINAAQISYAQSTTTLMRNGQPLADNVSGLRFYCLQSNVQATVTPAAVYYVTVSMTVSTANTGITYRSTVKPRNF